MEKRSINIDDSAFMPTLWAYHKKKANKEHRKMNLTTKEGVVQYMSQATSESDWNRRCDEVKRHNGGYPKFWYQVIILSGLAASVSSGWNK